MKRIFWISWYVLTRKMKIIGFHFGRNSHLEQKNSEDVMNDFVYTTVTINFKSRRNALSIKRHLWPSFDKD